MFNHNAVAQKDSDSLLTDQDYIQSFKDHVSLTVNINDDIESFIVTSPGTEIDLKPNTNLANSYKVSYQFISFSYTLNHRFINRNVDEDEKGKTKIIKYGTDIGIGKYLNQHLSFLKTRGYYLANTSEYFQDWESGDPYIQFPKLNYLSWHGITSYQPNPKFSIFASSVANQRQLRTAGSFIYSLSYRFYKVDDRTELTGSNSSQKSDNLEFILSPGYAFSYVFDKKIYFTTGLFPGIGVVRSYLTTRLPDQTIKTNDTSSILELGTMFATGYDNGKFYSGGQIRYSISERLQGNTGVAIFDNHFTFEVFLGFRLNAPDFLKSTFAKIKSKAGQDN